ncbi:MAG: hypothetical protein LBV73_19715, partial [Paraburkholderia sp.]|nr:hypothetical protein [Paraburkholderia sp.]
VEPLYRTCLFPRRRNFWGRVRTERPALTSGVGVKLYARCRFHSISSRYSLQSAPGFCFHSRHAVRRRTLGRAYRPARTRVLQLWRKVLRFLFSLYRFEPIRIASARHLPHCGGGHHVSKR